MVFLASAVAGAFFIFAVARLRFSTLNFVQMPTNDTPLALVGYTVQAARACRELGLVALNVPTGSSSEVLHACQTLHFTGALIAPAFQRAWFDLVQPDPEARRAGKVDAVAFSTGLGLRQVAGSYTYADALADALAATRYAARGASAMILGQTAADLHLAAPVLRQGFTDIALVADNAPEAEKAIRELPGALRLYPMSRQNESVKDFSARADLIFLAAGELPYGILQPYHTLIDLTGKAQIRQSGATLLPLSDLQSYHVARQLSHATGQRFLPQELEKLVRALESVATAC